MNRWLAALDRGHMTLRQSGFGLDLRLSGSRLLVGMSIGWVLHTTRSYGLECQLLKGLKEVDLGPES